MLPFVKGLFFFFFKWGEGSQLYFLSSFQLVDYGFFCICEVGDNAVLVVFRVGCKVSCSIKFMGRNFSMFSFYFKQTLNLFYTGICSKREEAVVLLWIVGHRPFIFAMRRMFLICLS